MEGNSKYTGTGESGTMRYSFPSHDAMDDQDGLSAMGLNGDRDGSHRNLFSHVNGKSCDICMQVVENELNEERESIVSVSGWNKHLLSSTTPFCERMENGMSIAICLTVVETLISIISLRLKERYMVSEKEGAIRSNLVL
tara:strand:+ start:274 stop:693 length:420 start_codon:yes stop_codon:yes gene_type:complete